MHSRLLEDMGLTVTVQKEYSEADDSGWPLVEPGYVMSVSPETGTSMTAGDSVTLTVSRGLDHGDTAQIPNVVGMTKNEALTALGKWVDITGYMSSRAQRYRLVRLFLRIRQQFRRMMTLHMAIRMNQWLL